MVSSNWFKNNKDFVVLAGLGLIFLFVYSWLSIGIEPRFTSPDETANYYFIKSLAEKNQLRFYEPLNQIVDGLIRPRSMGFVNGYTVPGSFLGIILIYGLIAKFFGSWIILYLTPLFSVIGVLFFYLLIKEIFSREVAFISSLLLFVLPPFWHYSSRGMFHNALFVDLLIIGLYFLIKFFTTKDSRQAISDVRFTTSDKRRAMGLIILSGFFIGLALITRTSEVTWVGIILLVLFVLNWSRINWRRLLFFVGPIILLFLPIFFLNNHLYGSPLSFAYSQSSIDTSSVEMISRTLFYKISQLIFPLGLNFNQAGVAAYQYLIVALPWLAILFLIGFLRLLKNIILGWFKKIYPHTFIESHSRKGVGVYLWLYGFTAVWLIIYYGSWEFYEYIGRTQIILGSSYLRYWLPIYIFGLPFGAIAIIRIKHFFKSPLLKYSISLFLIALVVFFSINTVLADPLYGLGKIKKDIKDYQVINQRIVRTTKPNSIIIAGKADKIFFPERRVIFSLPFDNNGSRKSLAILQSFKSQKIPIYYYQVILDENNEKFIKLVNDLNLNLIKIEEFPNGETLYKIN